MSEPAQPVDLWRLARKTSRAILAASQAASREYRLAQQSRAQVERADTAIAPRAPSSQTRAVANAGATRLIHLGFLAALPATLIALLNPAALFGRANWIEWLTIACGATLLPIGMLLARNWLSARDRLISRLHPQGENPHGKRASTRSSRIIATAFQLLGILWIPLGILALIRGSTNLH